MKALVLLALLGVACGKIQQVQDSIVGMTTSNDIKLIDVRFGALYRASGSSEHDYVEFENTRYRLGNVSDSARTALNALPQGQLVDVYFKGDFVKRSGVDPSNPDTVYDVLDLDSVTKK